MRELPNETLSGDKAPSRKREGNEPERKCILSGEHAGRGDLIRLALGPDGQVAPDVRARAPGRGAWIGVDRATLEAAQAKGKLKGALMRSFKTNSLAIPDDLAQRIEEALKKAVLDRLGLEARAGNLLSGSEKIEVAARRGEVRLLLHAFDAGEDGKRKLDQAWRMGDGEAAGLVFPEPRPILSMALGRQNVVHVALIDAAAAARVRHAYNRWRAFIGTNDGLSAGSASVPEASAVDVNEG
ncbi:DUF448 domain-containing protein [Allosphingosinicella vermicomposti]|uniref:DUF448 domain-containing protein n=1 Tax=Allosphingosinicella vermicomposti TaxID=614671 RepID=UPI003CC9C50E